MKKHYVKFLSPGTFVSEETVQEIDSWDIEVARKRAEEIVERHGARTYGFYFFTKERRDDEFEPRITETSSMYYLGGHVMTLEEVKKEMPNEHTLISNMERNNWNRIIINTNSWKITLPLHKEDIVL